MWQRGAGSANLFLLLVAILLSFNSAYAQDTTISDQLFHDSRDDLYRLPTGPVPLGSSVVLRLAAETDALDSVTLRLYNTYDQSQRLIPMSVIATTPEGWDLWEATVDAGNRPTLLYYRFIATAGGETVYYEDDTRPNGFDYIEWRKGGAGAVYTESPDLSYQISVYDPEFETPDWMKNAVIYQIFPDRFRNADASNDPEDGEELFYGELPLYFHETWNEPPIDGRTTETPSGAPYFNSDFYGGDLAGIIENLDYLKDLGVTAIYLNPVFEARSNHRYDTSDYYAIDPYLGTQEEFDQLVDEAAERGIRIILDGVFNHLSSDSIFFDRYHRFETDGACESVDSPYREWFIFVPPQANQPSPCVETPDGATYYVSWAGFDSIPKINNALIDPRRYIFLDPSSVVRTWLQNGIAGWRLDVANEIDAGDNPTELYWEAFRTVVKSENPDAVIIGEYWDNASAWLLGDEWDSSMNYRYRRAILGLVRDSDFTDNDGLIRDLTPSQFNAALLAVQEDYPAPAYYALMNLLDSHDTTRLRFAVDDDLDRHRLAALAMFALPGAPTIYYGDEIAIDAPSIPDSGGVLQDDPHNRAPYPWPDTTGDYYPAPDEDMLAFYQQIAHVRNNHVALRTGEFIPLLADDQSGVYAFLRLERSAGSAAIIILNTSDNPQTVDLDVSGLLPDGIEMTPAFGSSPITTGDPSSVEVPAYAGEVWTYGDGDSLAVELSPIENLQAEAGDGVVALSWDAIDGAQGYEVYRSPVATGGFVLLGRTNTPVHRDTNVVNGYRYYYAVAPVAEDGLVGDYGSPANAVPSTSIDATFYVMDSAPVTEPVEPLRVPLVSGAGVELVTGVEIGGVTDAEGPAPGILAQAALAPIYGDAPETWQPMTYAGELNDADLYATTLSPQESGEYSLLARFSSNAGQDWTMVEFADGSALTLIVEASDDTTAPDSPDSLTIERASASGIHFTWSPVEADDLYGYRIYRVAENERTLLIELDDDDPTEFTDTGVVEGDTYQYAVTAVDNALNESDAVFSDEVIAEQQTVQVEFLVEVPESTTDPVYLAGDFGSAYPRWNPAGIEMTQVDDTHFSVVLELPERATVEYKYVRGTWDAVEKGEECEELSNRRLVVALPEDDSTIVTVTDVVAKWRDLDSCG